MRNEIELVNYMDDKEEDLFRIRVESKNGNLHFSVGDSNKGENYYNAIAGYLTPANFATLKEWFVNA